MGDDDDDDVVDNNKNVVDATGEQQPLMEDSIQQLAQLAWDLSGLEWHDLGKQQQQQQQQHTINNTNTNNNLAVAQSLDDATERIVALLLVRIVAVIMAVQQQQEQLDLMRRRDEQADKNNDNDNDDDDDDDGHVIKEIVQQTKYPSDYSTTSLCRAVLVMGHHHDNNHTQQSSSSSEWRWPIAQQQQQQQQHEGKDECDSSSNHTNGTTLNNKPAAAAPPFVTSSVLNQLRQYVRCMLMGYHNDLPFHNFHHCYHVVISANKLLDLMLHPGSSLNHPYNGKGRRNNGCKTYGLRSNPNALLALMFAALIHDVGHTGVNNRQRVAESDHDDLALRYNDQSIHENYSLHVAFNELLKPDYVDLRRCMFPGNGDHGAVVDDLSYRAFRKLVIHVVLATDLTSPERLQLSASMFQEAYPDYFKDDDDEIESAANIDNGDEYKFADGLDHDNVDMDDDPRLYYDDEAGAGGAGDNYDAHRRASLRSTGSMPRAVVGGTAIDSSRRGSVNSVASDITMDSYTRQVKYRHVEKLNQQKKNAAKKYHATSKDDDDNDDNRRYSITSVGDYSQRSDGDSMLLHARYVPKTQPLLSNQQQQLLQQDSSDSLGDCKAPVLGRAHSLGSAVLLDGSIKSLNSGSNLESIAADSMGLTHQRQEGKPVTRRHKQGLSAARLNRRQRRASTGDNHNNTTSKSDHDDDDEDGDDGSLSLTPPSSEDELDGFIVTGISLSKSADHVEEKAPARSRRYSDTAENIEHDRGLLRRTKSTEDDDMLIASMRSQQQQQQQQHGVVTSATAGGFSRSSSSRPISMRRASTGTYNPSRFGRAISGQRIIEEEGPGDLNDSKNLDWSPTSNHNSTTNNDHDDPPPTNMLPPPGYFRKHLGIRRSMDFSGEALEQYSKSSCGASSVFSEVMDATTTTAGGGDDDLDYDEPNELRMTVVIEVFLKVADVAHWFQDWHVMVRFNSWLFRELCVAHAAGRGFDPRSSWFDNQIKAMEQYILPLADQFCHMGVLTQEIGASFPATVERNRAQWMEEGYDITQSLTLEQEEELAKKNKES